MACGDHSLCVQKTLTMKLTDTKMLLSWKTISCEKDQCILRDISYVTCNKQNFSNTDYKKCQFMKACALNQEPNKPRKREKTNFMRMLWDQHQKWWNHQHNLSIPGAMSIWTVNSPCCRSCQLNKSCHMNITPGQQVLGCPYHRQKTNFMRTPT